MNLERLLQITVATLAVLATLLLSMGQRSVAMPVVVIAAAPLSVWLTDATGLFCLKRVPTALAATVALLFCLINIIPFHPVTTILELARMLVYLQLILLFQKKEPRVYWQLLILSLLQVVVATVFSQGFTFGLLMVIYLFTALLALSLLCLHLEAGKLLSINLPGREIFFRVGMLGIGTLLLTVAAFFALPRLGQPAWQGRSVETQRSVGYSDNVGLGEIVGEIIENPQEVMRIKFVDRDNTRPVPVKGEIYLQGAVLTFYKNGSWSNPTRKHRNDIAELEPVEIELEGNLTRQAIDIAPMDQPTLFCVRPFFVKQPNPDLQFNRKDGRLLRRTEYMGRRFTFSLFTTAIVAGRQNAFAPADEPPSIHSLLQMPHSGPANGLPSLVRLADSWMSKARIPKDNWAARARFLKHCLDNDERFEYSLEGQNRDWEIDPIEDFVVNNPRGHCEYFATALTLMLRSQGIPARLVVGYKCDEFNGLGNYFQVRQLHAHTWVEVYLPREKMPPGMKEDESAAGVWMRLDPTPTASAEDSQPNALLAPLAGSLDWLEFAWDNYVMEMDRSRQQEAIYQPLVNWTKETLAKLQDPEWWRKVGNKILYAINPRNWNLSQWFSWRGGLIGSAICFVLVFAYRGCRLLARAIWKRFDARRRRRDRAARIEVAFYRRLGSLLAKRGLVKSETQTPREFARAAGARLAAVAETSDLAHLPEMVVEAFYLVRFGRLPLDKSRQEAVEHALTLLDQKTN